MAWREENRRQPNGMPYLLETGGARLDNPAITPCAVWTVHGRVGTVAVMVLLVTMKAPSVIWAPQARRACGGRIIQVVLVGQKGLADTVAPGSERSSMMEYS